MPYEGFSRGVIPELARHRHEHGQARADYSAYREADKIMGTEEERPLEDLARAHEDIRDTELAEEELAEADAGLEAADNELEMADAS